MFWYLFYELSMYITIEEEIVDITKMTNGFLSNALSRYKALLRDGKDYSDEYLNNKVIYEELLAEQKVRHRKRFKILL